MMIDHWAMLQAWDLASGSAPGLRQDTDR